MRAPTQVHEANSSFNQKPYTMVMVLLRYRVETLFPSSGAHPSPAFYKLSGSAGVEIVLTGFLSVEDMHLQVRVAPTGPPPRARAHRGARSQPLWCDFRKERKPDNSEISQASWEVPAQVLALNRVRCDAVPSVMVASQRWLDDDGAYRVAVLTEQIGGHIVVGAVRGRGGGRGLLRRDRGVEAGGRRVCRLASSGPACCLGFGRVLGGWVGGLRGAG